MLLKALQRDVAWHPVQHSWYHFSCFHQILGYSLMRDVPWGMDYVACREAVYTVVPDDAYPFFVIVHKVDADPSVSWRSFSACIEADAVRKSLSAGDAVIAIRDLYDVAGFRQFGRSHHPNWYLLTGFDRERRTFEVLAEEGGMDAKNDARCYRSFALMEAEVLFTARRASLSFSRDMGTFPHFPAIAFNTALHAGALVEQQRELNAALAKRANDYQLLADVSARIACHVTSLDGHDLQREHAVLSVWARKLRALQVLSVRRHEYEGWITAMTASMRRMDDLLVSSLFWEAQSRAGRLDRTRLAVRQRSLANGIRTVAEMLLPTLQDHGIPPDESPTAPLRVDT